MDWYREHLADDFMCIEANGSVLDKTQFLRKTAEGPPVVSRSHAAMLAGFLLLGTVGARPAMGQPATPEPTRPASCPTPEHRQFDFWIGDWDTYDVGNHDSIVARNRVDLILGDCVLREVYEGKNGLVGQSFSIYDAVRRVWHQSWVTNRGQVLVLEGRMEGDQMVLIGADRAPDGRPIRLRGVWRRVEGGVRETAETSANGGKTWKPLFDLVFRPHAP